MVGEVEPLARVPTPPPPLPLQPEDFLKDLGSLQDQLQQQRSFHLAAETVCGCGWVGEVWWGGVGTERGPCMPPLPLARSHTSPTSPPLTYKHPPTPPPCSWHSGYDTSLLPAHFHKTRAGRGQQRQELSKLSAPGGAKPPPGARGGGVVSD